MHRLCVKGREAWEEGQQDSLKELGVRILLANEFRLYPLSNEKLVKGSDE